MAQAKRYFFAKHDLIYIRNDFHGSIFSPSVEVDSSWLLVKKYIEYHMKVAHTEEEPVYFEHYDPK